MNTKDTIIDAAETVFAKHGYYRSTMDMIANEASVAKGTLYYNFPSKVALFVEVIKQGLRFISQRLQQIVNLSYAHDEAVFESIDFIFDFSRENNSFMDILFNELSGGIDQEALAVANELIEDMARIIASLLEEGMQAGIVRRMDSMTAAYALIGCIQAAIRHSMKGTCTTDSTKTREDVKMLITKGILA